MFGARGFHENRRAEAGLIQAPLGKRFGRSAFRRLLFNDNDLSYLILFYIFFAVCLGVSPSAVRGIV